MKTIRKFLPGMFTVVLVTLTACANSFDESNAELDSQSKNINPPQNANEDSSNADSTETGSNTDNPNADIINAENNDTNEKTDAPKTETKKEEDLSSVKTSSLKEEYLKKLKDTKKEMDEIRQNSKDETTYALKKVEGDRYDAWDGWLNEVYGILKKQLPPEEMDQLRKEQREWIEYRDQTAKAASLKYKGGTMEQLEYVMVQNNLTEERCFELVEDYMK